MPLENATTPIPDDVVEPAPWTYERFLATGDLVNCPLPPETIEKLRAIAEQRAQAAASRATRVAAASLPLTPAQLVADAEERLAREQREETDAAAWAAALKKHGKGRVGKVHTVLGDIILRAQTAKEADDNSERIGAIEDRGMRNAVAREATIDTFVHPDKDRARAILDRYPGAWLKVYAVRDALVDGEESDLLGKV